MTSQHNFHNTTLFQEMNTRDAEIQALREEMRRLREDVNFLKQLLIQLKKENQRRQ